MMISDKPLDSRGTPVETLSAKVVYVLLVSLEQRSVFLHGAVSGTMLRGLKLLMLPKMAEPLTL